MTTTELLQPEPFRASFRLKRPLLATVLIGLVSMAPWVQLPVVAASPQLVRLVDGSGSAPTGDGRITFTNVGLTGSPRQPLAAGNPLIAGNNLYGIDLVRSDASTSPVWYGYHGAWNRPRQVNDFVYLSVSNTFDPSDGWSAPVPVILNGAYIHVNDPSVVVDAAAQHMLYTAAKNQTTAATGTFFRDWINYSTSTDGLAWSPDEGEIATEIAMADPSGLAPGDLTSIARPALVKTDDRWKLWFDGRTDQTQQNQNGTSIHSYLAESTEAAPTSFEIVHRYNDAGGFPGFFEPDVQLRDDGTYLAVIQRNFNEIWQATSEDGVNFSLDAAVVDVDDPFYDRERVSNPGLLYDQVDDANYGVGFGMASPALTDHDIGFAYAQYKIEIRSPPTSPTGDPVWHQFPVGTALDEQSIRVFNFDNFDLVRITDPTSGDVILEQDFDTANVGDVWELQLPPKFSADFDNDGDVDAMDLDVWQSDYGLNANSDANDDGRSDGRDFMAWQQQFGSASLAAIVPEPASWWLLVVAGMVRMVGGSKRLTGLR